MAVAETRFRVMASDAHVIVVNGPNRAGEVARRALDELEQAWSRFLPLSDLNRINDLPNTPVVVNEPTITLIETMMRAWELTDGLYNPSILPVLIDAGYRFSMDSIEPRSQVPSIVESKIGNLSQIVVDRENLSVTCPYNLALDPGGIGKGLAADLVVSELLAGGADGALVSIGGDMAAAGTPPTATGWSLAIQSPADPATHIAEIAFGGGGVATSSTLSRRWKQGHTERHHLIDPTTEAVAQPDLVAVTIFAPAGWLAEAHATAAILGGADRFASYTDWFGLQGVAVTAEGHLIETPAFGDLRPAAVPA
ncbi:MAG: FAD:protein FMN transferase [Acidimicrobiales bacterium]|nr:FAD:protein FMN transferase [Acidimicrobiales bacterium]